jgi:hypothetical protein
MIRHVRPGSHGLVPIGNIDVQTLTTALFRTQSPISQLRQATRLNLGRALVSSQPPQVIQNASPYNKTVIDGMACTRDRVVILPVLAV